MTNHYIFTINDMPISPNKSISAIEIADRLFECNTWVYNEKTPLLKKLLPKDRILIYVCGANRRYFLAEIELLGKPESFPAESPLAKLAKELGLGWMKMYTSIRLIRRFEPPIPISNLIGSLEFIKDKKNYGLNLRLPIVNISLSDHGALLIVR